MTPRSVLFLRLRTGQPEISGCLPIMAGRERNTIPRKGESLRRL
nr:MAG TPA: hypothetical protein [Caudoviricetes sp.]